MGRLARDPSVFTPPSGTTFARMTLAVDRRKKKDGTQEADFPSVVAWGKTAEFCEKYLAKGKKILVEGRIQTGSYEKDGQKIYTTDVVAENIEFAESKRVDSAENPGGERGEYATDEMIPF